MVPTSTNTKLLTNLIFLSFFQKKKMDFDTRKPQYSDQDVIKRKEINRVEAKKKSPQPIRSASIVSNRESVFETTAQLIDIINELNLKSIDLNMPLSGNSFIIERFPNILPTVYELLKNPFLNKFYFVFLKFIYWSLLHCDVNQV